MFNFLVKIVDLILDTAKSIIVFVMSVAAIGLISIIAIYFNFSKDLPDIKSIKDYHPAVVTEVFSKDNEKIGEYWLECRLFLPFEEIPSLVKQAFIDSEDENFFAHTGVDFKAIFRAFIANIRAGEIKEGGSTITQQLTRSLVLSREKKFSRKIKEAILSTRLERHLDKKQILTLYLNEIFLGNRAYGVGAAARNYFHKDIKDLNIAEAALIAGMPSAPHAFSPLVNPAAARQRQDHVLSRMLENGSITKKEALQALSTPIKLYKAPTDKEINERTAPFFVEHVRRILKDRYGDDVLYRKGLKVYTTLDLKMQRFAEPALKHGIEALDRRQGYRGVDGYREPKNYNEFDTPIYFPPNIPHPEIVNSVEIEKEKIYSAVVTGFKDMNTIIKVGEDEKILPKEGIRWARPFNTDQQGFDDATYVRDPKQLFKEGDKILVRLDKNDSLQLAQYPKVEGALIAIEPATGFVKAMVGGYDASSEFNRATQAVRQPGSSFKPYVYAAALDKGYSFKTVVMDAPISFPGATVGKPWSPKNYKNEFKGPTSFHNCLTFSKNVPTVRIGYSIGTHYITAYTRKFGISTPFEKYLPMVLGSNSLILAEHAAGYAVFANYGIYRPALYITKIVDNTGNVLEEYIPPPTSNASTAEILSQTGDPAAGENEFNNELFSQEMHTIKKDNLILSPKELKILYGSAIPSGHVITPRTAYLMVKLMQDVVNMGTATRVKVLGRPIAGKTGTTNDETDAWFLGFTPDLLAGAWLGFDEVAPIGRGEQGGRTAAPVFIEFMRETLKDTEVKEFLPPPDFPEGDINSITGGSSSADDRPNLELPDDRGGSDRAGRFFEEELEDLGR